MRTESEQIEHLTESIARDLNVVYGPVIGRTNLISILAYPSNDAFRQALCRKTVPVPIFTLDRVNGKFALTREVAAWLAKQRIKNEVKT